MKAEAMEQETRFQLATQHSVAMYNTLMLPKNEDKGHWCHESIADLLNHLDKEVEEFKAAIWNFQCGTGKLSRVFDEGSDVSNIVAMISSNCAREDRKTRAEQ